MNKRKSRAKRKRIRFLQITLEIKASRKGRLVSEGRGDTARASPERRGRRAPRAARLGRRPPGQPPPPQDCHWGGGEGDDTMPKDATANIFFINIFYFLFLD